jgi:hypothetical protein
MRKVVPIAITIAMIVTLSSVAAAQQTHRALPSKTVAGLHLVHGAAPSVATSNRTQTAAPTDPVFFCPKKKCLYYSGDFDTSSPNNNGLFDIENPGIGVTDAEVWVGVKPKKNATVTGVSGTFFFYSLELGINPTPFMIRTNVSAGEGGKLVCNTSGNATLKHYGDTDELAINSGNYYIAKLSRACHLEKGKIYYIFLSPQYNDSSTVGYLADSDGRHLNQRGWPEVTDDSYFNSTSFGAVWEPTWGSSGACGGIGCSGFSISLTGKE